MKKTDRRCPLCYANFKFLFENKKFRFIKCPVCKIVTLERLPSKIKLKNLYDKRYFYSPSPVEYGYADYPSEHERFKKTFLLKAKKILSRFFFKNKMLLDVGCAAGFFLEVMKDKGFNVKGVELSSEMTRIAKKIIGNNNILEGFFEDMSFNNDSFDLITFWDTLEHFRDPFFILKKCYKILKKDGLLCIETQNPESFLARFFGKKWHHYKPLEHLWYFPPLVLKRILINSGFSSVKIKHIAAGRWVSWDFIKTKCLRYFPFFKKFFFIFDFLKNKDFYINPLDEYIVTAKKA